MKKSKKELKQEDPSKLTEASGKITADDSMTETNSKFSSDKSAADNANFDFANSANSATLDMNDITPADTAQDTNLTEKKTELDLVETDLLSDQAKKGNKWSQLSKAQKITIIVLLSLLLVVLLAAAYLYSKFAKIRFADENSFTGTAQTDDIVVHTKADTKSSEDLYGNSLPQGLLDEGNILNIMLLGVDSRSGDIQSLSDSMVLATIDFDQEKIYLHSFLRDTYVYIPGYGYSKLNAANVLGGPPLLLDTLEENYRIKVDKYAAVNMTSMADIVDILGGVEIDVKDWEIDSINKTMREVERLRGEKPGTNALTKAGKQNLNGSQAVAYARIRNVGNSDYERTDRQRRVLESIFNKARRADFFQLNSLADEIFPKITTNLSWNDIMQLIGAYKLITGAELESGRVPIDGSFEETYIDGLACLVPDLSRNITYLAQTLYGKTDQEIAELFPELTTAREKASAGAGADSQNPTTSTKISENGFNDSRQNVTKSTPKSTKQSNTKAPSKQTARPTSAPKATTSKAAAQTTKTTTAATTRPTTAAPKSTTAAPKPTTATTAPTAAPTAEAPKNPDPAADTDTADSGENVG